jgi:hypothetical protein
MPKRIYYGEFGCSSPEYCAWGNMKDRCGNPNYHGYKNYGGRGIKVCEEWLHSFQAFISHVGRRPSPGHSIDRIDNNGNYEPGNVRWATPKEQAANKRPRSTANGARLLSLEAFGRKQALAAWVRETGRAKSTIRDRIAAGWSPEEALATPPRGRVSPSGCRLINAFGEARTVRGWARGSRAQAIRIYQRLRSGWSPERAISEPTRPMRKKNPRKHVTACEGAAIH